MSREKIAAAFDDAPERQPSGQPEREPAKPAAASKPAEPEPGSGLLELHNRLHGGSLGVHPDQYEANKAMWNAQGYHASGK